MKSKSSSMHAIPNLHKQHRNVPTPATRKSLLLSCGKQATRRPIKSPRVEPPRYVNTFKSPATLLSQRDACSQTMTSCEEDSEEDSIVLMPITAQPNVRQGTPLTKRKALPSIEVPRRQPNLKDKSLHISTCSVYSDEGKSNVLSEDSSCSESASCTIVSPSEVFNSTLLDGPQAKNLQDISYTLDMSVIDETDNIFGELDSYPLIAVTPSEAVVPESIQQPSPSRHQLAVDCPPNGIQTSTPITSEKQARPFTTTDISSVHYDGDALPLQFHHSKVVNSKEIHVDSSESTILGIRTTSVKRRKKLRNADFHFRSTQTKSASKSNASHKISHRDGSSDIVTNCTNHSAPTNCQSPHTISRKDGPSDVISKCTNDSSPVNRKSPHMTEKPEVCLIINFPEDIADYPGRQVLQCHRANTCYSKSTVSNTPIDVIQLFEM